MSDTPTISPDDAITRGHEPDAVNTRLIVWSSAGLVLLVAFVLLLIHAITLFVAQQEQTTSRPAPVGRPTRTATGPQAIADQPQQLRELRQAEQRRLNNYQWIDEPAGIARIPIDRAMDILAERGLPAATPESGKQDDDQSN